MEVFEITVIEHFAAAHRLRGYRGRCEKLHGHNYRVEVTIGGETLDRCGLLMDFGVLKKKLKNILRRLDHSDLNRLPEFRTQNPSAENLARLIFQKMKNALPVGVALCRVSVWESENAYASYGE